ncbi:AsmA-like C-terminal region-containing protein [Candidatus Pelagibacter sp.]|nr:AsmA-like C-terminal region-containing protein [Candidatus Pelagibacter sp.]
MKKNLLKYIFVIISILSLLIVYLSIFGLETDRFNSLIRNKINQFDKNIEIELKKIRLTLNPLNFKVKAKTISPNVFYKKKIIKLEYIQTQISLISLIKNQIVSSKLKISTKSISLTDLIAFARVVSKKPELFILETATKNGQVVVDVELNFDETGKIKNDYEIKAILKDGKLKLLNNFNFEKINFLLNINNKIFDLKSVNFVKNNSKFSSENIKITKDKKDFFIEGNIKNEDTILNNELLKFLNIDFQSKGFFNTNFNSNSRFSFSIDKKFKVTNLVLDSNIQVNESEYKIPNFLNNYLEIKDSTIKLKNHKIKYNIANNKLKINGSGKIKIQKNFDDFEYNIDLKDKDFILNSQLKVSKLKLISQEYLKKFTPNLKDITTLKDQTIDINFNKKELLVKGKGKIKFSNEFEDIVFRVSKIKNKFDFNTQLNLNETLLKIDFLNFEKNPKLKSQIKILGSYDAKDLLYFKNLSIIDNDNKLIIKNIFLDQDNLIEKLDEANLEFFDNQNRKNNIILKKVKENEYQITGLSFNAEKLIDNSLTSKKDKDSKFFKNDFKLNLDLNEVYLDSVNIINNLKGKLDIKNNEIYAANIFGDFDNENNLKFTINTNNSGEKITTLFSSRAKPLVNRYKFIKGFEDSDEGYLDFYSLKKNGVSNSKLIIDNFKVKEIPVLAKLLALASLQGIADLLTGEGIRFSDFEMNFTNKNKLMTIQELYAIGPAISILIEGYIQEDDIISLRGTLVPATTINRSIASIPLLGDLLIGKKVGEGVFGVSFKVKGPPKKLQTTVNPIKTLTPRFITRTLEKIKKD